MIRHNSDLQLTIEELKTLFQASLLADNRWVKLRKAVPWDKFASAYISMMEERDFKQVKPAKITIIGHQIELKMYERHFYKDSWKELDRLIEAA